MAEIFNSGKITALDPGLLDFGFAARVSRKLRNTIDVWFGP